LGAKASYSCPSNNGLKTRQPDFVTAAAVKCKACSARATVTDLDPQAGKFWVGLQWGPLMSEKGAFVETDITSYTVHIVDSKGRILSTVGEAPKVKSTSSCCIANMYSYTAAGTLPAGYNKFMIVPNVGAKHLPMGILSDAILDVTAGLSTKITGSFTMKVSNPTLFKTDKKVNAALREAIADTITGVDKDNVRITGVTDGRRLEEENRRLAAGSVKVSYTIVVPETYTGPAIKTASIVPATLMKAINTRVAAKGVIGATVTEAPVVATVTVKSVGIPRTTGGAYRGAQMGAFVGVAALLAMFQ